MTKEQAQAALAFLERTTLKPAEISAFAEVANALNAIANPKVDASRDDSLNIGE